MGWFDPPALVAEPNAAVETRLATLEAKDRLDLDEVAEAVALVRAPARLAEALGDPLRYAQRVEAEVSGVSIEVLLPHAAEPADHVGRFVQTWVPDELGHARALDLVLERTGLDADPSPVDEATVPFHNRVVGTLARVMPRAYEMVSLAYHTIGAVNERLALAAYTRMGEVSEALGEHALAQALFGPLRRDEAAHLGYYRTHARQLRDRLAPWQRRAVRVAIVRTYAPVGAGRRPDKAAFGRTLEALEDHPEDPAIGRAVQQIATELLAEPDAELPPFVVDAMRTCLDEARRAA